MKKKSKVILLICCAFLILPNILSARCNEWAEFFKNKHILSYAIQDSIHWIGTGLGLFRFNSKSDLTQSLFHITNIDNGKINDIAVSKNGSVWFVINETSLFYLNEENWTHYSSLNSDLPKGEITKITTDDSNNLWLIVDNRLIKYNGKNWLCYPKIRNEHCSNFMFFDILINNGIIWVHTNEGLAAYHNNKWEEYKLGRGYKVNSSWNFVKGKDNGLFILYYNKIQSIIKDSLITFKPLEIGIDVKGITAFKVDDHGVIYFARNSGEDDKSLDFLKIKDNNIIILKSILNDYSDYDYVQQIDEDKRGNIFIITTKGLYKFKENNIKLVWSRNFNIPLSELNKIGEYKNIAEIKRFGAKGEGIIINNQEEGHWTYKNKNDQIIMEGDFISGKKVGIWKTYYDNGSIERIIEYKNGFKDGYYVEHYKNGNKKNKMSYSHGKLDGKWIYWHENGVVKIVGEYENNLKEGV